MARFSRSELDSALAHYDAVVAECTRSGSWSAFADLFTEDCVYTEHAYGVFSGREAVREWITAVMAPFPHMRFPQDWIAYDDANDAVVIGIQNVLDHDGTAYGFPNWTRLVYAGNGLFASEEDVYNPARDAPRVVAEWVRAGGRLAGPVPDIPHG